MKDMRITPQQKDFYRENGYLVVEDILTPSQLALWRRVIDTAVEERGRNRFHYGSEDHTNVNLEYYDKVFTQRVNLWKTSVAVRALLHACARTVGQMAAELEDVPSVRVWHDQALYKETFANPTSWHLDMPYWSFDSAHALTLWLALDDASVQNGCMYMLPGSHLRVLQTYRETGMFKEIKIGTNMSDLFSEMPELKEVLAARRPVPIPMKAGSCSFHNGMTVHAAGPNMTAARRRAMTIQMMPGGCRFNGKRNVLTDTEYAALRVGDEIDDDVRSPVMYSRER